MTVWVVFYGDEVAAIYSSEPPARAHADSADGYTVTDWTVLDDYED